MISDDEFLERIVAGVNANLAPDAKITWNAKLGDRQFDVVLEFRAGPYSILLLIEVKDHKRKTPAEDIEAFITKAKDQLANKIIFVNKSGYQSGAINVAKKHGVELFKIAFLSGTLSDPSERTSLILRRNPDGSFGDGKIVRGPISSNTGAKIGPMKLFNNIVSCTIVYDNGTKREIPSEPTQMEYYVEKSKISDGRSIREIIKPTAGKHFPVGTTSKERILLNSSALLTPPDEHFFPAGYIHALDIEILPHEMETITGATRIEPTSIAPKVEYKNVITDQTITLAVGTLPLGDQKFEIGRYYFSYFPLRYYHCNDLKDGMANISIVESFQNGELIRATYTQEEKYAFYYIPVSDQAILTRLQKRLAEYRVLQAAKK